METEIKKLVFSVLIFKLNYYFILIYVNNYILKNIFENII